MNKTIVLAADRGYLTPLTATIKSVLYNNRDVDFYMINTDIPQEWFRNMNRHLQALGSQIIDRKIGPNTFASLAKPHAYVTYMTYGKLLTPELVPTAKALYLDSDVIVNGNLDELFNTDLGDYPVAAVRDIASNTDLNAGVLLFNNQLLRKDPDLISKLFDKGQHGDLNLADQSILNAMFNHRYLSLPDKWNYMIGSDSDVFYTPSIAPDYIERMANCPHPVIIHYTSADKPWKLATGGRMRELWWQYANLDWYELITHSPLPNPEMTAKAQLFTFTQSNNVFELPALAKALPDYQFHLATWTGMADNLFQLSEHHNIRLYPLIAGPLLDQLIHSTNVYLDINDGKEEKVIEQLLENDTPVLTFESVKDPRHLNNPHYEVFADDDVPGMAARIRRLTEKE